IFVWGGRNGNNSQVNNVTNTMYVFEADKWKSYDFDNAPNPRASYSATLLDDRIIYIGGISKKPYPYPDVNFLEELLIFDTKKLEWSIQPSTSDKKIANRAFHSALLCSDSISIIMYGGIYEIWYIEKGNFQLNETQIPNSDSVWILNTKTWTWSQQS
ncbi:4409_t:CDS:2, partial [Ambispora gerdemannii]